MTSTFRRDIRVDRRAVALLAAVTLLAACGNDGDRRHTDSGRVAESTCLVAPPLVGLRLGDSSDAIPAALGPPIASVPLDDGGNGDAAASVVIYRFPRADVHVVRGRVDRIVVTERGGWPKGLAVGSTRAEVDRYTIGRRVRRMTNGDVIEIAICPDDWARLYLRPSTEGRRVSRVELLARHY